MTVIAWDGKTLAADKRGTDEYGRRGIVSKIGYVSGPIKRLYGLTGDEAIALEMLAWYSEGAAKESFPASARDGKASLIIIRQGIHAPAVDWYTKAPLPVTPFRNCFGSGCEMAAMALLCGKTARQAVELTSELSAWCGDGIDTIAWNWSDK